jgi:flagellar basal body-associated protein FliL
MQYKYQTAKKGECKMFRKKAWVTMVVVGFISLMTTPAFARSISIKDAGVALWIFILIGAFIVLLQLIPAAILFFSFVGTTSTLLFKGKKEKAEAEEKKHVILPDYEPTPVEK